MSRNFTVPGNLSRLRHRIPGSIVTAAIGVVGVLGIAAISFGLASYISDGEIPRIFGLPGAAGSEKLLVVGGLAWSILCAVVFVRIEGTMPHRHLEFSSSEPVETALERLRSFLTAQPHSGASVVVREGAGRTNRYVVDLRIPRSDDPSGRSFYDRMDRAGFDVWFT